MKYVYSVIRFVPDPVSGESINLGVIVGSDDSGEWEVRQTDDLRRVRSFDTRRSYPHAVSYLAELSSLVDEHQVASDLDLPSSVDLSEAWLTRLAEEARNLVQISLPAPIAATTLQDAIDLIGDQFLTMAGPDTAVMRGPNKRSAVAAARTAFREQGLRKGADFGEKATISGPAHRQESFDLAVFNGKVLQLVQGFSFYTAAEEPLSRQVRAWAWTVRGIRDQGGRAAVGPHNLEVPKDVDIEAVYLSPQSDSGRKALDEALSAFAELRVVPVEASDAQRIAQRANDLLAHAR